MITCEFEDKGKAQLRHVTVNVLIIKDEQVLLVKRAPHLINPNKYAIPGGFLDRNEDMKTAAKREAMEETGYDIVVKDLFVITDNPHRKGEDRQNVNITYLAEPHAQTTHHDDESTEVTWFSLHDLPDEKEFAFDHYEIFELYQDYLKEKHTLPIIRS